MQLKQKILNKKKFGGQSVSVLPFNKFFYND